MRSYSGQCSGATEEEEEEVLAGRLVVNVQGGSKWDNGKGGTSKVIEHVLTISCTKKGRT